MPRPATHHHKRLAIASLALALVMAAAALAALLHAFAIEGTAQWPAIVWQLCQLLAICFFGAGLWQLKKHRDSGDPEPHSDTD